ncbi:MAG: hypothetical protein HOG03_01845 [Desulfobacula sp.]|jgi:hypothetical protein|uniref:hypothetical protein n=1 Tax=Desulfobacula sp. TaxID=2593537 RepID=UPI001D1E7F81|nr:hypothetical protein [Desulfobacula sp.]MBT3484405.1 hypothetical protein [Desulfobacula sp.]MBT3803320.1 hypothetical protein [Desulfobacula sp.]MBT4023714.1 hypothetical protein [Desulfobacula sp.]MBT4197956.1 hypothetical protein [Desulfobacula sp.]
MAQKITLSIPDLLHEKLKEWRASFNLSKMFQEVVTDAILKKEEFQKRFSKDYNMSEIIKRLKQEKLIWERQYYKLGKEEGLRWAKTARYEDFLYVLKFDDTYKLVFDSQLFDYFDKIYQSAGLEKLLVSNSFTHEKMFIDGWFKGISEFWNHVKEKL